SPRMRARRVDLNRSRSRSHGLEAVKETKTDDAGLGTCGAARIIPDGSQVSGATITGLWVGRGLPPFGSGVTRISLIPPSLGGSPISAAPVVVTLKSTLTGVGVRCGRLSHSS